MSKAFWILLLLGLGLYLNIGLNHGRMALLAKLKTEPERIGFYQGSLLKSFVLFSFFPLMGLVWLLTPQGFLELLTHLPEPYEGLYHRLHSLGFDETPWALGGLITALVLAFVLGSLGSLKRAKKALLRGALRSASPVWHFLPRTPSERFWGLGLALVAGFGEEISFRLLLPLVLFEVTGQLGLSIGLSLFLFGMSHIYQGFRGMIITTLMGAGFFLIYLYSGQWLWMMMAHGFVDAWVFVITSLSYAHRPEALGDEN